MAIGERAAKSGCCGNNVYNRGVNYMDNRGFATSPSRFSFYGGVGTVTGINSPTSLEDMYMSTRTPTGWVTTLPGLNGNEAFADGAERNARNRWPCAPTTPNPKNLGLPAGIRAVPLHGDGRTARATADQRRRRSRRGTTFHGWQRMSGDFSHFVFSSSEYLGGSFFEPKFFTGSPVCPGGVTNGVGSAYDNDIAERTVQIISKLPNGENIPTKVPRRRRQQSNRAPGALPERFPHPDGDLRRHRAIAVPLHVGQRRAGDADRDGRKRATPKPKQKSSSRSNRSG